MTFIVIIMLGFMIGCQRVWYLSVVDTINYHYPVFCISENKNCRGKGVGLPVLAFFEVNERGEEVKTMWLVEPIKNLDVKKVIYGKPPEGWREKSPALPLEIGKQYSLNDKFFFRFSKENTTIVVEIEHNIEFYSKIY